MVFAMEIEDIARAAPVIPVITVESLDHAVPMAQALIAGGLPVLEITLRTPVALDAIRQIANSVPEAIVGAGTATSPNELRAAFEHGAQFAISPGLTDELARYANDQAFKLIPGVQSPSEIMLAKSHGFRIVKFFPAEQSGGVAMLKAYHGPFGDMRFIPTGGITPQSARQYLDLPYVEAVGGSWLTPKALLTQQDWAGIKALASAASHL